MDVQALIRCLDVPFDLTVHDYYGICPQVNLLPMLDAQYCGEPAARHCNACIAATPGNGATDIDSWRFAHAWMFRDAARVLCPSEDARARLARHGLGKNAVVVPHEAVPARAWALAPARITPPDAPLRVVLLGVLADRKGLATVAGVAELAGPEIALHLLGHPEQELLPPLSTRLTVSGAYAEADLPALIGQCQPHVFWFPAQLPETYSYTLSAAIAAGGAIVAADLGAFTERLRGRPLTWLVPAHAPAEAWLAAFAAARQALGKARTARRPAGREPVLREPVTDYYAQEYLRPLLQPPPPKARSSARARRAAPRVLIIPECLESGLPSPCAYIRLLQPLHHPAIAAGCDMRVTDLAGALAETPDIIITQRHALDDAAEIAALAAHCRARKIRLIYDLDDDLLDLPDAHPDAGRLRPLAPMVEKMLAAADRVWVSTPALARRLGPHRGKALVLGNGLDELLWWPPALPDRAIAGKLRLLCMGTGTHAADLALILPVLERVQAQFGDRVAIDIIGVTPFDLPPWLNRVAPPHVATRSYPAFINWLSLENAWHIGLAPLADTAFNRGKSAIKAMDYAGLGIPTIASDIGVYDGAIDDGVNGLLVANTDTAWFAALAGLIRDPVRRQTMAKAAQAAFREKFCLAAQAAARRKVLRTT